MNQLKPAEKKKKIFDKYFATSATIHSKLENKK